jgi:hypothetical protein
MAHDRRDEPPGHEFRANSEDDHDSSHAAQISAHDELEKERHAGEEGDDERARISLSGTSPFDDLPDDFPDSAGIDLDPDFSSLESSAELDNDAALGEERPEDGQGSEFSEFADIDNPEMAADLIGETSQDEDPGGWADPEHGEAVDVTDPSVMPNGAAAGERSGGREPAMQGVGLRPRPQRRRTAAGSLLGVVIGGLLSLPVVAAILVWGFRRDDFGIARSLPEPLAFLVPTELRPPRPPRPLVPMPPPPPLESPPQQAVADPVLEAAERAALTMATARAEVMLEAVLDLPDDAPSAILAPALIDWYKSLATVAEEAAVLERELAVHDMDVDAIRPSLKTLSARITASPRATHELARLTRQWMQSSRRSSDGIFLAGMLEMKRQAGSAWVSAVVLDGDASDDAAERRESSENDTRTNAVTVLSRRELAVAEGQQVVVLGVLVSEGVVWAADAMPANELDVP